MRKSTNSLLRRNFLLEKAVPLAGVTALVASKDAPAAAADVNQDIEKLGCAISSNTFRINNVRCFGAKGDGIADDTRAIRTAIAALPTGIVVDGAEGNLGGIVYFPGGIYRITGLITISSSGIHLIGAGRTTTTILNEGGHEAIQMVGPGGGDFTSHGSIERLTIQCTTNADIGITMEAVSDWLFDDLIISGPAARGIEIIEQCITLEFRRVQIVTIRGNAFHVGASSNALSFIDCRAVSNSGEGIYAAPLPNQELHLNWSVRGGTYESNDHGIYWNNVSGGSITTYFENNQSADIQLGTPGNPQSQCVATTVISATSTGRPGTTPTQTFIALIQGQLLTVIGTWSVHHGTGISVSASQEDGRGLVYMGNFIGDTAIPFVGPTPAFKTP